MFTDHEGPIGLRKISNYEILTELYLKRGSHIQNCDRIEAVTVGPIFSDT